MGSLAERVDGFGLTPEDVLARAELASLVRALVSKLPTLERALIERTLDIRDYETAFNDGMRALLDIVPSNPREGCGQDVHIPCGMIGYKPDYLISRLVLTQLAAAACRDRPDMEREFAGGDFTKAAVCRFSVGNQTVRAAPPRPVSLRPFAGARNPPLAALAQRRAASSS